MRPLIYKSIHWVFHGPFLEAKQIECLLILRNEVALIVSYLITVALQLCLQVYCH